MLLEASACPRCRGGMGAGRARNGANCWHREENEAPQAQHRHTELSLHVESPPLLPSSGLEQGCWRAGTLPGCCDSDSGSASPARLELGATSSTAVTPPREVMKCPQELLGGEQGVTILRSGVLPIFIFLRM